MCACMHACWATCMHAGRLHRPVEPAAAGWGGSTAQQHQQHACMLRACCCSPGT
ncbi:unnamed protein product, partial [Musa textilis]